jgi:glycerophosphoryl diester phosphodiesterase
MLAAMTMGGVLAVPAQAFVLQAHRGARGPAPENTVAGLQRALETGDTPLELDIGMAADGVPLLPAPRGR